MCPRRWADIFRPTSSTAEEDDTLKQEISTAVAVALDKKALDLVVLDLQGLSTFTDYFVICHGTSTRHVQAIADAVEDKLRSERVRGRVEGYREGEWVLMDFVDFVVHIFTSEKREYFDLERLWGDAPRIAAPGAAEPVSRRRRRSTTDRS